MPNEQTVREKIEDSMVALILRQTNYSRETAVAKLQEWKFNPVDVIKEYMQLTTMNGGNAATVAASAKVDPRKLNQTKFKLMRKQLDISNYNNTHQVRAEEVASNFREEKREINPAFLGN